MLGFTQQTENALDGLLTCHVWWSLRESPTGHRHRKEYMGKIDWLNALDLKQAVDNIKAEIPGDWYQDPWGWPELGFMLQKQQELIAENLNVSGVRRVALLDVPKENWGTRPAVILDIADRLTYHALADNLSVKLIGSMSPDVYGWRLPPNKPKPGVYSHNNKQWDGYRSHLINLADLYPVALKTDLVSFFASIPVALVQDAIQDRCQKNEITKRLCDMIDSFGAIPDRSGLVQRSTASAVLANMYVDPLDDVLKHHSQPEVVLNGYKVAHRSYTRWMDDIWLFGHDAAAMRRAQMDLQAVAQTLGLNLNYAKTEVLEGAEVAEQAKEIEHSAVDDALDDDDEQDFGPLEALIEKLLLYPEKASRTSLKFAATRMRKHNSRYRIQEIVNLAPRMPHAADGWSRLFKEAFTSNSLQDWYLQYVGGDWATHEWSVAHFGRMFPSNLKARQPLREFFEQSIRDANTGLPLLAVASQRLGAWDADAARDAYREGYRRSSTPHARRVLGLAALGVGETRTKVKSWLSADAENAPTLAMLESYGWKGPKVQQDFAN
jgi:hypothetical protein